MDVVSMDNIQKDILFEYTRNDSKNILEGT